MEIVKKCVMAECDYYKEYGECSSVCERYLIKPVLTNYDRVRNMSIDEIAVFMGECGHDFPPYCDCKKVENCDQNCLSCAKQWLSQEI